VHFVTNRFVPVTNGVFAVTRLALAVANET